MWFKAKSLPKEVNPTPKPKSVYKERILKIELHSFEVFIKLKSGVEYQAYEETRVCIIHDFYENTQYPFASSKALQRYNFSGDSLEFEDAITKRRVILPTDSIAMIEISSPKVLREVEAVETYIERVVDQKS